MKKIIKKKSNNFTIRTYEGETIADALWRTWMELGLPAAVLTFDMDAERFATLIALARTGALSQAQLYQLAIGRPSNYVPNDDNDPFSPPRRRVLRLVTS